MISINVWKKKIQPFEKVTAAQTVELVHNLKILNKVKMFIVKDIVNSINIIICGNNLIEAIGDSNGIISLYSRVDGAEGLYDILNVHVELTKYNETFIPKVYVKDVYLSDICHEFILTELDLQTLVGGMRGRRFNFTMGSFILDATQNERMCILDKICDIMSKLQEEYKFRGYTKSRAGRDLL